MKIIYYILRHRPHCLYVNLNDQKTSHFYWCIPGMLELIWSQNKTNFWHRMDALWDNPIIPFYPLKSALGQSQTQFIKNVAMEYCLPVQMTTFGQRKFYFQSTTFAIFQKGNWILESATGPLLIRKRNRPIQNPHL